MNDLERQYLRAAHELSKHDAMRSFNEDDVTNHLDLNLNEPGYADRFIALTRYHLDMGFVESVSKGGGMGRRTLKLTGKGLEEAERLSDPMEQRKAMRERFLRVAYDLAEERLDGLVMMPEVALRLGMDADDPNEYGQLTNLAKHFVERGYARRQFAGFEAITLTPAGIDAAEGNKPEPQPSVSNVFNVSGNFYQSAIGTHNTNNFSGEFDFSTVEQRIEAEGGADKEDLHEIVNEMRDLLERGGTVDRGFLACWNDKLQKYHWLAGAVAGWLLNFSTQ